VKTCIRVSLLYSRIRAIREADTAITSCLQGGNTAAIADQKGGLGAGLGLVQLNLGLCSADIELKVSLVDSLKRGFQANPRRISPNPLLSAVPV
jgi:hypothetical protein